MPVEQPVPLGVTRFTQAAVAVDILPHWHAGIGPRGEQIGIGRIEQRRKSPQRDGIEVIIEIRQHQQIGIGLRDDGGMGRDLRIIAAQDVAQQ